MTDFFTKGLSLRTVYQEEWDRIGEIFDKYHSYLRSYTPALTVQELKNIELADILTQQLKDIPQIASVAEKNIQDTATIESRIFEQLLLLIPEFNRQYAGDTLKDFLSNGNSKQDIHNLFTIDGTVKKGKREIEMLTCSIVKKINGGKINEEISKSKI